MTSPPASTAGATSRVAKFADAADLRVSGRFGMYLPRGRFGMYLPPLLEELGLVELEYNPPNNRVRALSTI